jgi:hypothetical protein
MCKKVCSKCGEEKSLEEFGKLSSSKDGFKYYCKKCNCLNYKIYREKYPDKKKETSKKYRDENKDKWFLYYEKNKEIIKNRAKKYNNENREYVLKRKKEYYEKNKEKLKPSYKKYKNENKDKRNEQERIKKQTDILYHLKSKVRCRLNVFLKSRNITKRNQTFSIVGCTPEELKVHLETQFTEGMTWGLLMEGKIHLDHILPLSSAKTEEEVYKLCHYSNLQPLWAEDNLKKGNKIL